MRPFRSLLVLTAFLAGHAGAAAPSVMEFMPADTHMAFWVDNIAELREAASANPAVRLATDETHGIGDGPNAISRALSRIPLSNVDPLSGFWGFVLPATDLGLRSGIEATTSIFQFSLGDVNDAFEGGFGVFSTLYNLYTEQGIEIVEWDVILAAEIAEGRKSDAENFLQTALSKIPRDARRTATNYFGVPVFRIEYYLEDAARLPGDSSSDLGLVEEIPVIVEYAWTNHHLLLAEGRGNPLERALRAHKESDPRFKLAEAAGFRRARTSLGEDTAPMHFYMDVAHHVREWGDFPSLRRNLQTVNALGLQGSGPLLVDLNAQADAIRVEASLVNPREGGGVFALLGGSPENRLDGLNFIPADSRSFGSLTLDLNMLYKMALTGGGLLQPREQAVFATVVKAVEAFTQINIERDLLAGSSGELVSYMRSDVTASESAGRPRFSMANLFPIRGSAEAMAATNALVDRLRLANMGLIDVESTDLDGLSVWETPEQTIAAGGAGMHFVHTPRGFITATSGAELRALLRLVMGQDGESIANTPLADAVRRRLPAGPLRGFHFTAGEAVVDDVVRAGGRVSGLPPAAVLRESIGDSWWALRATDRDILLTFVLEAPPTSESQ